MVSRTDLDSWRHWQIGPYAFVRRGEACLVRSLTADRQTLAAFRPPALEDQTPVLRAHAHQESVRPFAMARIGLERALSLHDIPSGRNEPSMLANAF